MSKKRVWRKFFGLDKIDEAVQIYFVNYYFGILLETDYLFLLIEMKLY